MLGPLKACLLVVHFLHPGVLEQQGHHELMGIGFDMPGVDLCANCRAHLDIWHDVRYVECRVEIATAREIDAGFPIVCTASGWCERNPIRIDQLNQFRAEFNAAEGTKPPPAKGGNHPELSDQQTVFCLKWDVPLSSCSKMFHP